ncbi:MAG: class I SAM-dependent methyltransferase [Alphaproteobacteria bacterium]|nr:class I SAM-dependent methyltransferase [Alphaproteobacteria bacterium]
MKQRIQHLGNSLARRALKFSDRWAAQYWHFFPLGTTPQADKQTYLRLWEQEKESYYPEIDRFEKETEYTVDPLWFHDLALHTQIVIKNSPLCYQHGRILYTTLRHYLSLSDQNNRHLTIFETGTARGFSSVIMAKALTDANAYGKIITFDILPHNRPMYWNCIDDHDGSKTRADLLAPWREFVSPYILFFEGDSRINLNKVAADRINFAFLDGAHTYRDVLFEFQTIAKHQKKGDVIVFDDYNTVDFPGLVRAVDEGCERWGYDKKILSGGKDRSYVIATKRGK